MEDVLTVQMFKMNRIDTALDTVTPTTWFMNIFNLFIIY